MWKSVHNQLKKGRTYVVEIPYYTFTRYNGKDILHLVKEYTKENTLKDQDIIFFGMLECIYAIRILLLHERMRTI